MLIDEEIKNSDYNDVDSAKSIEFQINTISGIKDNLRRFGFAVVSLSYVNGTSKEKVQILEQELSLGQPYVPILYTLTGQNSYSEYVDILSKKEDRHPGFSSATSLTFHVDGLLEPIGFIPTTLIYCVNPAQDGGKTTVLNSVGIYNDLMSRNPRAAEALADPNVLTRFSTIPEVEKSTIGPAFQLAYDGGLVNRYSHGPTEKWNPPIKQSDNLNYALDFFSNHSKTDCRRRISIQLKSGECLIMMNNKISHGRTSFIDNSDSPRHLIRALYLNSCI